MAKSNSTPYQKITEQIIATLEECDANGWEMPWRQLGGGLAANAISHKHYRGINRLILGMTAYKHGYSDPRWVTYKQAKDLGGNVRRGEKSTRVVFFKPLEVADKRNPDKTVIIPLARYYSVFNVEQCDDLRIEPVSNESTVETDVLALARSLTTVHLGGDRAFHMPSTRAITMPHLSQFTDQAAFDATLLHELVHWTAPDVERAKDDYAFEELVAELGSVFLCESLGIEYKIEHHASYLKSWLKALKDDPKYIVKAARLAEKASEYLLAAIPLDMAA